MKSSPPLLLALVALALASCTKRETAVEAGLRTQTLLVGVGGEPADFDPHTPYALAETLIFPALFEGLTVLDEKNAQVLPGAAERWEISADGLVYTFHLRPAARWSNGDPVTADDFAFAFRRLLQPALGGANAYYLWPIKNAEAFNKGRLADIAVVGIEVVDTHTLRLELERPTAYLLSLAACTVWAPLHRATLEKFGGAAKLGTAWTRPGNFVGNGPFTLAEWKPNDRVVVTKNPHYWEAARTQLARIVFLPIENNATEEHAFRSGQLHVTCYVPAVKLRAYRDQPRTPMQIEPHLGPIYLQFNTTRPPLGDRRVRRALALALDREAIAHNVYADVWTPAHSFVPPGCPGYTPRAHMPTDFAAARQLLADAGFSGGRGLPALSLLTGHWLDRGAAEAIQSQWQRELGLRVGIELNDEKTRVQNLMSKNYGIAVAGWGADFPDPATFLDLFLTSSSNNYSGWSDADYDRLIDQGERTVDAVARFELLQQAEARLLDAAPISPLFFQPGSYLVHPAVKNWEPALMWFRRYQFVRFEAPK